MKKLFIILMFFCCMQSVKAVGQLAIVGLDNAYDGIALYDWINICNIGDANVNLANTYVRGFGAAGGVSTNVSIASFNAGTLEPNKCIFIARDGVVACGTTSCDGDGQDGSIPATTSYNGNPATVHGSIATPLPAADFTGSFNFSANWLGLVIDSNATHETSPTSCGCSFIEMLKLTTAALTNPNGYSGSPTVLNQPVGAVGDPANIFHSRISGNSVGAWASYTDSDAINYIKTNLGALSVSLVSATAAATPNGVSLNWATASESNNSHFEIEQLVNGTWTKVAEVAGKGTTSEMSTYTYEVQSDAKGMFTFRIKQIDLDGSSTYSKEMSVLSELPSQVVLGDAYPNPFSQNAQFNVSVAQEQVVKVSLYNVLGQEVAVLFEGTLKANEIEQVEISKGNLPAGQYFYQVAGAGFSSVKPIAIVR